MTKAAIRYAVPEDLPVLLAIDAESFPAGVAYDAVELAWYMNKPEAVTLVLEDETGIAGFLIVELARRRRAAVIVTIDVRTAARRCGYGSLLMQRCEALLQERGIATCRLQVDVENDAAIVFYRRRGFRLDGLLKRYYPNGHDAHVMVKTLPAGAGA